MDSAGIGELPDASKYGDEGSNTIGNICRRVGLQVPTLRALGLDRLGCLPKESDTSDTFAGQPIQPMVSDVSDSFRGAFGRMAEASAGKDSVTGHWEMMGIVLDRPFPVFPH